MESIANEGGRFTQALRQIVSQGLLLLALVASARVNAQSPPTVTITSPTSGTTVSLASVPVTFTATASDPEDGDLTASVTWSSSIDGALSNPAMLAVGTHTITASVTDSNSNTRTNTISLTVLPLLESTQFGPSLNGNTSNITLSNGNLQVQKTTNNTTTHSVFASTARSSGKFAFQIKPLVIPTGNPGYIGVGLVPAATTSSGAISASVSGSLVYRLGGTREKPSGPTGAFTALAPLLTVSEPLLVLVDFDTGKVWLKRTGAAAVLLYDNLSFGSGGMRPAIELRANASVIANFTGPFEVTPEAGYLPWAANYALSDVPTLSFSAVQQLDEFTETDSVDFSVIANDTQDGNISANVVLNSSRDGTLTNPDTLSVGLHRITASVTDSSGVKGYAVIEEILVMPTSTILDRSLNSSTSTATLSNGNLQAQASVGSSSWTMVMGNSVRRTGKYAFQYTPISIAATNYAGIGLVPATSTANTYFQPGSYAYYGNRQNDPGGVTTTLPLTAVGEPLLFLVDFDARKVYVQDETMAEPMLLFENFVVPSVGMRPGLALRATSSAKMNFAGPFDVNLPAGYVPWGGHHKAAAVPQLSFENLVNDAEFSESTLIDFGVIATDSVDGDISANVAYTSSRDGTLTSEDTLSPGFHKITATVTNSRGIVGYILLQQILVRPTTTMLDRSLNNSTSTATLSNGNLQAQASVGSTSWTMVMGNSIRRSGKYAFQYTPISIAATNYAGIGLVPSNSTANTYFQAGSYAYYGNRQNDPGGVTTTLPLTAAGEPLLFLVDFDARKIYVQDETMAEPMLLSENIVVPSVGMRPGLALRATSSAKMNFAGPFDVNLPAGYVPWGGHYAAADIPTLSFDTLEDHDEYLESDAIDFDVTATDAVDGNVSSNVSYISTRDGAFDSNDALSPGFHRIHAIVTNSRGITGYKVIQEILVQPLNTVLEAGLNNVTGLTLTADVLEASKSASTWASIFGNSVRKTGKYAFELKTLTLASTTNAGVGIVPARTTQADSLSLITGAYGYRASGMQVVGNNSAATVTDPMYPTTPASQSVLFMVDLDAGTIRVRGEENSASVLLLKDLQFSTDGMRPALELYGTTTARVNFAGPFAIPVDPGYLPWGATEKPASIPQVTITAPADRFKILDTALPFTLSATASDLEDGNLSSNLVYRSNINGLIVNTSTLSAGIHTIWATVTDSDGNIGGDSVVVTVDTPLAPAVDMTFNSTAGLVFSTSNGLTAERDATNATAWVPFYLNKTRNTGKYAFEFKQLAGATGTSIAGIAPANQFGGVPGAFRNSYAYINNAKKYANGTETGITTPDTQVGESLLVMVDLDAGTIRIRGSGDSASALLFSGLSFPDQGMRPGFALKTAGTKIEVKASWPFTIPVDTGYLPWDYTSNLAPKLDITWPGTQYSATEEIAFTGQALDYEDGNLTSTLSWTSSKDGALGTGGSISGYLSEGDHMITASSTDSGGKTATSTHYLTILGNGRPAVSITSPADDLQVGTGVPVAFTASASDPEDGNLSSTIAWVSDKDGALGTGGSLSLSNLSQGLHLITASATDTGSNTGSARTLLLVGSAPAAAEYTYNAFGQRVAKTDTNTSTTVHFIYDPEGRVIAEIEAATGDTLREYIYLDGQQVAMVDDTDTVNEEMYFVHGDHLGTPQKITDDTQQVIWAADYEPFGNVTVTTDTIASSKDFDSRFPGQYSDHESGLHYNYFRDYDPETGRYIESDPIGLRGGLNTYGYVNSNPLRYSDPTGQCPWCVVVLVWQAAELGMAIYDAYDTAKTLTNECASTSDKAVAGGLFALGMVLPGGGYSKADDVVDLTTPARRKHILDGDGTGGGHGPGRNTPNKSKFPGTWSDDKAMHAISDVATSPSSIRSAGRGGRTVVDGEYEGVKIRVIQESSGEIVTGYPRN